jgi:hypothetical protein
MVNLYRMNLLENLLDLHKRHRWLTHLLFWVAVLVAAVGSSKYFDGKSATYGFEFLSDFLYQIPEILAAYAVAYWVIPRLVYRRHYIRAGLAFLAIAWLACVLGRIFIVKIDEPLAGVKPKAFETWYALFTDIPKLLYVYFFQIFSTVFLFLCLKTLKDQVLIRQHTLLLEKEKAETELKLLKAQLNPHFLFNTLNNIYALSFTSQPRTSASIARLADILDHILYRSHQRFVPLPAEIDLLRNYIELEKLRYSERLNVNFYIDGDTAVTIAPLILLSLVENAFKHGASNDAGEPVIDIRLTITGGRIHFEIKNTVDQKTTRHGGLGLDNLRQQLQRLYGKDHELHVSEEEQGWFRVGLTINPDQHIPRHAKDKMPLGRR